MPDRCPTARIVALAAALACSLAAVDAAAQEPDGSETPPERSPSRPAPVAPPGPDEDDWPVFAQPGFYLAAGWMYAPEDFGEGRDFVVQNSTGIFARAGYRIHPLVAFEARAQWLEGFEIKSDRRAFEGQVKGWVATANLRIFVFPGRFQPYLVAGGGVWVAETRARDRLTGEREREDETEGLGRGGLGLDVYLTEHIALNAEVAYVGPSSDLKDFNFAELSAGLHYRF